MGHRGPLGGIIGGIISGIVGGILGGIGGYFGAEASQTQFNCGPAGFEFLIAANTFQYGKTTDLKIRGKPQGASGAIIRDNIFQRPKGKTVISGLFDVIFESDDQHSIVLQTDDGVNVTGSNKFDDDTFGRYGICDIDGDGIDDLVLMTGVTWWFSSAGQFPWSFLKADPTLLADVKLGDVDGDGRCDIVKDAGGANWMVASGGTADWKPLGSYLAPLNQVHFGRFDPAIPDHDPGIRPPTHAFWRSDDAFWFVTPLSQPSGWTVVESSSFPLTDLRFGDFTGDGVTDVLANEAGRWAFSYAARMPWQNLNPTLNDPVKNSNIFIANVDSDDNIDDILRLDTSGRAEVGLFEFDWSPGGLAPVLGNETLTATWQRSINGTTPWNPLKSYTFPVDGNHIEDYVGLGFAFVGQFRGGFGATVLTIDPNRIGRFLSPGQRDRTEWESLFAY